MVRANMEDVADLNTITVVCYFKDKAPKLEMYNVLPYPLSLPDEILDEYREATRLKPGDAELVQTC